MVVEVVEVVIAKFTTVPVIFGELSVVTIFGDDLVDFFVELGDCLFSFGGFFVVFGAFDVSRGDIVDSKVG